VDTDPSAILCDIARRGKPFSAQSINRLHFQRAQQLRAGSDGQKAWGSHAYRENSAPGDSIFLLDWVAAGNRFTRRRTLYSILLWGEIPSLTLSGACGCRSSSAAIKLHLAPLAAALDPKPSTLPQICP